MNSLILTNIIVPSPMRRMRRTNRNIIINQRNIEELEEMQLNEALERSMTEI